MIPRETLEAFDAHLAARGLRLEAVVIGGAALALLGITDRQTRDVDVLHPDLPSAVTAAAAVFAREIRLGGAELGDDWLNNGPRDLQAVLPAGWQARLRPAYSGEALALKTLGRPDLLLTKLFALCDRGTDLVDCIALAPTSAELAAAKPWVASQPHVAGARRRHAQRSRQEARS